MKSVLFALVAFVSTAAYAAPISVVTFNMKWFGLGGGIAGQIGDEFRDPWIFEFSATSMGAGFLNADVLVLQEVVETQRLRRLLPSHFCQSYTTTAHRHQHVVICVKQGTVRIERDGGDDNFAIEEINDGSEGLRPAVHGMIVDGNGANRFHIIGLHLKAGPEGFEQRLKQVKLLREYIDKNLNDGLPILITGDFNAYEEKGDHAAMSALLAGKAKLVASDRKTYRSYQRARQFDLFFIGDALKIVNPIQVPEICQPNQSGRVRFESFSFYEQMVSDHCPVRLTVE